MKLQIDLAGSLRSKRDRYFPLQNALLELIDNSVDEGASTINIRESEGDLIIEDNGLGFKDIESALIIGKSTKDKKIGRFGVGLKDACLRYSEATVIESNGKRVCVPWKDIIDGTNDGDIPTETVEMESLTRIILQDFRSRYKNSIETKEIRRTYQPLIESGSIEITITGTQLDSLTLPNFTETIKEEIIFDGKKVFLFGGIYASNDPARSDWRGYNPYYNGRLIGSGKITNCGTGEEGCNNFCFMLHLSDDLEPWGLATNKDEVAELEDLLDYIYHSHTRPILERGATQAMDIELKSIEEKLNEDLNASGNITRAPRTHKPAERKTEPKPGSPKRKTKTATSKGDYSKSSGPRRNRIKFQFQHLGTESMGEVLDNGKTGMVITANLDNAFIAANKNNHPVILFFAKLSHSIYRQTEKTDIDPSGLTAAIMDTAGAELAFTQSQP